MATRFEIVLHGDNPVSLRAAGEEALAEIERLENQLSLYRPASEIAHLNARAAHEWVRVSPAVFRLLRQAKQLSDESGGAFDITVGPLIRCWGFMGANGAMPDPRAVAEARAKVGMQLVRLNETDSTVRFASDGVMLDLGAIGKGYAIECAAELLREAGVSSALLHGGTSSVQAIGRPPEADGWNVAIEYPAASVASGAAGGVARNPPSEVRSDVLAVVPLRDEAMSVSAVWGKSFQSEGKTFGHVIDPRTGAPAMGALLATVVLPSVTETDALSTALLTLGLGGHDRIARLRHNMRSLVLERAEGPTPYRVSANGIDVQPKAFATISARLGGEKEN